MGKNSHTANKLCERPLNLMFHSTVETGMRVAPYDQFLGVDGATFIERKTGKHVRSIPKIVAVGCAVAALAAVGAVPASAGTAHPMVCPPDSGYDFSGSHTYYRDMEPRSGGDSGTTISITFHKGKTTTSTVGGTAGAEAKVVFAKASVTFDYHFAWQWTNDSTYTWSWKVPDKMKHGYLHAGVKARYTKWNHNATQPDCSVKVLKKGTAHLLYKGRETWHGAS